MRNILQSANELMLTDVVAFFLMAQLLSFLRGYRVSGEYSCSMCFEVCSDSM